MRLYLLLVLPFAAFTTHAAEQQRGAAPHPADPAAKAPAARYESAFADYRTYREEKLAPWREVNEEVGRIGGHAGMFRAGQAGHGPAKPAAGEPASSATKKPAGQAPARGAPQGHPGH